MTGSVIQIRFSEDLAEGRSLLLGDLLNRLRGRMEMSVWRAKNRAARPTEDPETWDWEALERLDRQYEMVGLP